MAESSILAHQFDDLEQQHETATLGMWLFLATEIIFFGGLFTAYTACRSLYPDAFAAASHNTEVLLGSINTVVLLGSSFTMALAVHAAQQGKRRTLVTFLLCTIALGLLFLVIKFLEYHHKFVEHLVPGHGFRVEGPQPRQQELFVSFYFAMTGLHALHMVIGIALLAILVVLGWRGRFSRQNHNAVEVSGLYWHFVDIVWIFLFPLLYLIDRYR